MVNEAGEMELNITRTTTLVDENGNRVGPPNGAPLDRNNSTIEQLLSEAQNTRHSLMTTKSTEIAKAQSISNESSDAQERPRCGNKALRFYADVPSDEDKDGKMDDEYEDGNDRKVAVFSTPNLEQSRCASSIGVVCKRSKISA